MKKIDSLQLEDLYINQNKSIAEIAVMLNVAPSTIMRYVKKFNLHKAQNAIKEKVKATCLQKYGGIGTASAEIKEKVQATCLQKYGVISYLQTNECQEKTKIQNLEKYGVEYFTQTEECQAKIAATCQEKYKNTCFVKTEEFKEKSKQTCLERYGVEYASQADAFKEQVKNTCNERYGGIGTASIQTRKKIQDTCLVRYGAAHFFKSTQYHDMVDTLQAKRYATLAANNTFVSSSPEERFFSYLLDTFDEADVIRQYKDSSRYPFACDFYIKSQDLFIELNINWTHGGHPFDSTNKADLDKLATWQEKAVTSAYYRNAIETWTNRDVKKLQCAKNNNLNYIAYYSEGDIYD